MDKYLEVAEKYGAEVAAELKKMNELETPPKDDTAEKIQAMLNDGTKKITNYDKLVECYGKDVAERIKRNVNG